MHDDVHVKNDASNSISSQEPPAGMGRRKFLISGLGAAAAPLLARTTFAAGLIAGIGTVTDRMAFGRKSFAGSVAGGIAETHQ